MFKIILFFIAFILFYSSVCSQDGWYSQPYGLPGYCYYAEFVDQDNGWAISYQRIINTSDGGETWEIQYETVSDIVFQNICFIDKMNGWAVDHYGNVLYFTTDGGNNWEGKLTNLLLVNEMQFLDSLNGWIAGYNTIQNSKDGGNLWNHLDIPIRTNFNSIFFIDSLTGWVVGNDATILHTKDGGINWIDQTPNITGVNLNGVYFTNTTKGWAIGNSGIVINTTDGGSNWELQNSGLTTNLNDLTFVTPDKGWIVGTDGKIIYTSDGGNNWINQFSNESNNFRSVCFIDSLTGWIAGEMNKVLKTTYGGISSIEIEHNNKNELTCIPNPISNEAIIECRIEQPAIIKLAIYDILGNEVLELKNGLTESGYYKHTLRVNGLLPGVYLCCLKSGHEKTVKKIVIIK